MNWTEPLFHNKKFRNKLQNRGSDNIMTQSLTWPILPSSQTRCDPCSSSTSCPTVSDQAPAAAGLKGQLSPACEAALLLAVPTQPANTSLLEGWLYLPGTSHSLAGGEEKATRWAPAASEQAGPAWEGKGRRSLALLAAEKPEISESFSGSFTLGVQRGHPADIC